MATKTTVIEKEVEKPYDPMKDYVTVTLPRATGKEETHVFVGLNGKGYNIMRGTPVRVPRPVADILSESERMQQRQYDWQAEKDREAARVY